MIFTLPSVGVRSRYSFTTVTTRCYSGAWRIKRALHTAIHALRRGSIPKMLPLMPKDSMRAAISPIPGHGEAFHCRHLVVATGKLGLRGVGDARDNSLVGLKMHLRPTAEIRRALTGRRPALGQSNGRRMPNRRRDCDRARFGRARGQAYPGRPLAGRLPHSSAAVNRPHDPAGGHRFGSRRDRRRT